MSRRYAETVLGNPCNGHQATSADWLGVYSSTDGSAILQPTLVVFNRTPDRQTQTFSGFEGRTTVFTDRVGRYVLEGLVGDSGNFALSPAASARTAYGYGPAPESLIALCDLQVKFQSVFDAVRDDTHAALGHSTNARAIYVPPSPSGVLLTAPTTSSHDIVSTEGVKLTTLDPGISYDATTKILRIFAVLPAMLDAAGNVHQMSQAIPLSKGGQLEERHWRFMLERRPETSMARLTQLMQAGDYTTCVMAVRTGLAAVLDEVSEGLREDLYTGVTDENVHSYRMLPPRGIPKRTL